MDIQDRRSHDNADQEHRVRLETAINSVLVIVTDLKNEVFGNGKPGMKLVVDPPGRKGEGPREVGQTALGNPFFSGRRSSRDRRRGHLRGSKVVFL